MAATAGRLNICITGATGYIGGSVFERLLAHPDANSFRVTVLTRSQKKADKINATFKNAGGPEVDAVVGSTSDIGLLKKLSSEADVVFSISDCDDVEAIKGLLRGQKERFEATGKKPTLIHTSGTGVLLDKAGGLYASDTVWVDADSDQIETLADDQPHRPVDLLVVEADRQGYVETYIIFPSVVSGIAKGRLVDLGIQNPYTMLYKRIIKEGIKHNQGILHGGGKNIWSFVDMNDLTDLYVVLFNGIRSNVRPPALGHGRDGFYFAENGETALYDVYKYIAVALSARGIGSNEPKQMEIPSAGILLLTGGNMRCRAKRSRAIGWKPTKTVADMLATIDDEVEAALRSLAA